MAGAGSGTVTQCPAVSQVFHQCPLMPDPWHGLLLPSWGPVPQPPAWVVAAREAAVSPWQWLLRTASHGGRHSVPQVSISATPSPEPQPRPGAGITHAARLRRAGEQPGNFPLRFSSKIWSGSARVVSRSVSSQPSFTHGGGRSALAQGLTCPLFPCGSVPPSPNKQGG